MNLEQKGFSSFSKPLALVEKMSDSSDESPMTQPTQQITPKKRRVIDDEDDDEDEEAAAASSQRVGIRLYKGGPPASPVARPAQPDWMNRVLFKGRSAREAVGQRVAVT